MNRKLLYEQVSSFPYGKSLACEALNIIFQTGKYKKEGPQNLEPSKKSKPSYATELNLMKRLVVRCSAWDISQWMMPDSWRTLRDELALIIKPKEYLKYRTTGHPESFKFSGMRANRFGSETLLFIKGLMQGFSRRKMRITHEIRSSIDLLEIVIRESLVDASVREDWKKQLVNLCYTYKYLPKSLNLTGLIFTEGIEELIGSGGCAEILLGELDGQKVIVKVMRFDKAIKMSMRKREWGPLHEEALNWIGLDCPGLNPFFGITYDHPRKDFGIGLVFKYQPFGDSTKYLKKNRNIDRVIFVQRKMFYFASTLHYLHRMDLVHGDIKGANILVDEDGELLLTDFGLMKRALHSSPLPSSTSVTATTDSSGQSISGAFTLRYASPERIFRGVRSEADDVWATAMTVIEFLTGKPPFSEKFILDRRYIGALYSREVVLLREDLPASVPDDLYQVLRRCISYYPEDRPSTFELFTTMGHIAGAYALRNNMKEGYS